MTKITAGINMIPTFSITPVDPVFCKTPIFNEYTLFEPSENDSNVPLKKITESSAVIKR